MAESVTRKGHLFVFSGPSGTGKGTVLAELLSRDPALWFSVSVTTRPARAGEVEGRDYHFVSQDEYDRLAGNDGLLEGARVFGCSYGTPRAPIDAHVSDGVDCILDIDVQGALQVKGRMPEAVLIFLEPPSIEELRRRLQERGTESAEEIERRLAGAADEMSHASVYNHILVNVQIDETVAAIQEIIAAYHSKE